MYVIISIYLIIHAHAHTYMRIHKDVPISYKRITTVILLLRELYNRYICLVVVF